MRYRYLWIGMVFLLLGCTSDGEVVLNPEAAGVELTTDRQQAKDALMLARDGRHTMWMIDARAYAKNFTYSVGGNLAVIETGKPGSDLNDDWSLIQFTVLAYRK